ncbi:hypothetical protein CEXT_21021 [Caerostris extrusa]|uniref:Uncharacterized protein n=1 Tax=Caerostris extrusa TaxID=172846 RepID=A0AAV4QMM5_CAEEX|nr:hypothetical protein CEXT_21021 [Caerostris extrusa]
MYYEAVMVPAKLHALKKKERKKGRRKRRIPPNLNKSSGKSNHRLPSFPRTPFWKLRANQLDIQIIFTPRWSAIAFKFPDSCNCENCDGKFPALLSLL